MFSLTKLSRSQFLGDTKGSVSVEAVLIAPLLIWGMVATYVFYDGFRHKTGVQMAANTVVDIMSRQTETITPQQVEDWNNIFDALASSRGTTAIRVTSVAQTVAGADPVIDWSHGTRGILAADELEDLTRPVPPILTGEAVIVLETFGNWTPPFTLLGMEDLVTLNAQVASRPRFVPWLPFEGSVPVFTHYNPEPNDPNNAIEPTTGGPVTPPATTPDPGAPSTGTPPAGTGTTGGGGTTGTPPGTTPGATGPSSCQAQNLVSMTFESSDTAGWSINRTAHAAPLTRFLGRFGQNEAVTFTRALPSGTTETTVAFDLYVIDSWDGTNSAHAGPNGDRWQLLVNNEVVTSQHFTHQAGGGTMTRTASRSVNGVTYAVRLDRVTSGSNTVFGGWADETWRVSMTITNPPQNLVLGMRSELNSGIDDESWGIDNFTITVPCTVRVTPAPNPPTEVINVTIPFWWSTTYQNWFNRPNSIPENDWNNRPFTITGGNDIQVMTSTNSWATSGNLGWSGLQLRLTTPAPGTSTSATLTVGTHRVEFNFTRASAP